MAVSKIYEIFMKNYRDSNGNTVTEETPMYSIPMDPDTTDPDRILNSPVVKTEMGKTGTFEFSLHPNNVYYSVWNQLKTILRVTFDGETLFRGRVLTIDSQPFTGEEKIHCEGDLAFLMDSFQEGIKEENRKEITILQYLQSILTEHNRQMVEDGDPDKVMTLGEVPGQYSVAIHEEQRVVIREQTFKFGESSYQSTMQRLESLIKEYGGYLRTRYVNGTCYLDWLDCCFRHDVNPQPIELGLNLVEMSGSTEVDNIFTAVVPVGKNQGKDIFIDGYRTDIHGVNNKRILVPQIVSLYSDAELNKGYHSKADYVNAVTQYGVIYKTQNFPNADTQEKLWNYAVEWIKENYAGGINTLNVQAVDLLHNPGYFAGGTPQKFLSGDRVTIIYPDSMNLSGGTITKTLTILSTTHNLYNPEKNDYRIGIPNNQLSNRTYGKSKSSSAGAGDGLTEEERLEQERQARWSEYRIKAWNYVIDAQYNSDTYQQILRKYGKEETDMFAINTTHAVLTQGLAAAGGDADKNRFRKLYNTMNIDGGSRRIEFNDAVHVDPLASWTDEDIANLSTFKQSVVIDGLTKELGLRTTLNLITDPNPATWRKSILKAKFSLTPKKDQSGEVKTEEAQFNFWSKAKEYLPDAETTVSLFGEDGLIGNIASKLGLDGSGKAATIFQDGLTSMLKFFNPGSVVADPDNPSNTIVLNGDNGTQNMGVKTGGGWRVQLNNTVTYLDKDGHEQTAPGFVSAEDFNLPDIQSFKTKLIVTDQLIAGKVDADEISARMAYLDKLMSETIYADTSIRSDWIRANHFRGDEYILNVQGSSEHPSGAAYLGDCYASFFIYSGTGDDAGKIFFKFTSLDGKKTHTENFKIADTQFYKDAVSAATSEGENAVKINKGEWSAGVISFSKSEGTADTKEVRLTQANAPTWDGTTGKRKIYDGQSQETGTDTGYTVTIDASSKLYAATGSNKFTTNGVKTPPENYFGFSSVELAIPGTTLYAATGANKITTNGVKTPPSGYDGYSTVEIDVPTSPVQGDDIQLGSYNNVSTEPEGTLASNMKEALLAAIRNKNWFRFKVTVNGTTAEKYYKMNFGDEE